MFREESVALKVDTFIVLKDALLALNSDTVCLCSKVRRPLLSTSHDTLKLFCQEQFESVIQKTATARMHVKNAQPSSSCEQVTVRRTWQLTDQL